MVESSGYPYSVITAEGARYNNVVYNGEATVSNSVLKAIAGSNTGENELLHNGSGRTNVFTDSKLILSGTGSSMNCAVSNNSKIGSSLVQGPICGTSGIKIVNSWDENFNPIPNQ